MYLLLFPDVTADSEITECRLKRMNIKKIPFIAIDNSIYLEKQINLYNSVRNKKYMQTDRLTIHLFNFN